MSQGSAGEAEETRKKWITDGGWQGLRGAVAAALTREAEHRASVLLRIYPAVLDSPRKRIPVNGHIPMRRSEWPALGSAGYVRGFDRGSDKTI